MTYTFNRQFPETRLRRLRYNDNVRAMIREVELHPKHFIAPVFVIEGKNKREAIASMPGVERLSIDLLINYAKELLAEGVTTIDIFPVIDNSLKTPDGKSAYDENGLSARAVKSVKDAVPEMVVMTDVALDPYTSHGQDGLLDDSGYVVNDDTVAMLVDQAINQAWQEFQYDLRCQIVDDAEWQKVLQSVYTGFSFGGYAVKRWKDEEITDGYIRVGVEFLKIKELLLQLII